MEGAQRREVVSADGPGPLMTALAGFAADRESAAPVYRQIADHIDRVLADANAAAGQRLPSEEALAAAFAVNRATLRRAIQALVERGVVVQVHGRGTFATSRRIIEQALASSLISFSEALKAAGIPFTTQTLAVGTRPPPASVAARLRSGGEVWQVRRLRFVEGVPVILLDNYLPRALFPDLGEQDLAASQLFTVLTRHYGAAPHDGTRTFQAVLARGEVAALLRIGVGAPVMYAEQTTRRQDGTPIEASDMWIPGERFKLHADITRAGSPP